MLKDKKVIVVLPAYNAAKTLEDTYREIPCDIVDIVLLVDDASTDDTVEVARKIGIRNIIRHTSNKGYGANQKSCYDRALELQGDIIIMVHPDYQYTPKLIHSMSYLIANGLYPVVLGSKDPRHGSAERRDADIQIYFQQVPDAQPEHYHRREAFGISYGIQGFSREVLENINYHANSDDFVFDNQMLSQILYHGYEIAEITCPTKYFEEGSSINFRRSITYGLGVLRTSLMHFCQKHGLAKFEIYTRSMQECSNVGMQECRNAGMQECRNSMLAHVSKRVRGKINFEIILTFPIFERSNLSGI